MHRLRICRWAVGIAGWLLLALAGGFGAYMAWSNPDQTSRRLFLDHWPVVVGSSVACLFGGALATWASDQELWQCEE